MATPLQHVRQLLRRVQQDQLEDLLINRHIFQQFEEATNKHVRTDRSVELAEWMAQCYVAFASTAIRRMVEPPPMLPQAKTCPNCGHVFPVKKQKPESSVSLVILLEELKKHPSLLTRMRFCQLFRRGSVPERFADQWFDKIAGQKSATEVSIAAIDRDIAKVKRQTKQVKRLVNKLVGHTEMDRRRRGRHRYGNLNSAINVLSAVFKKYALLIDGREPASRLGDLDLSDDFAKLWP